MKTKAIASSNKSWLTTALHVLIILAVVAGFVALRWVTTPRRRIRHVVGAVAVDAAQGDEEVAGADRPAIGAYARNANAVVSRDLGAEQLAYFTQRPVHAHNLTLLFRFRPPAASPSRQERTSAAATGVPPTLTCTHRLISRPARAIGLLPTRRRRLT